VKHIFSFVAAAAMLNISFVPAFLPAPLWLKVLLIGSGILGLLAFGFHLFLQSREEKKRETQQEERTFNLIKAVAAEFESKIALSKSATAPIIVPAPSPSVTAELGMSADDPRIYLEIERSTDAMFRRTPFILHNRGKDVAHAAQIQSFKLKRKEVAFSPIEEIPAGGKKDVLPVIKSHEPMNEHDIFYWLLKDWDGNGELLDEWPIPLTIEYWDFTRKKKFSVTMNLVFHAIRYLLDEKHGGQQREWPPRNYARPLWEFRDIQFKRVS
jgi:hypothetical protein